MNTFTFRAMGTVVSVQAALTSQQQQDFVQFCGDIENLFSAYRPESFLSRFNNGELPKEQLPEEFLEVWAQAKEISAQTDGAFSLWRDGRLDLNGYVKGWVVKQLAELLENRNGDNPCADFLLNVGGDIHFQGHPKMREMWRIGIDHPLNPSQLLFAVEFAAPSRWAVATSGVYQRGEHFRMPSELLSATVIGPDIARADAYATTVMEMGIAGVAWIQQCDGYETIALSKTNEVFVSENFGDAYSVWQYVDKFAALA